MGTIAAATVPHPGPSFIPAALVMGAVYQATAVAAPTTSVVVAGLCP